MGNRTNRQKTTVRRGVILVRTLPVHVDHSGLVGMFLRRDYRSFHGSPAVDGTQGDRIKSCLKYVIG
jgi:hypothetical protein